MGLFNSQPDEQASPSGKPFLDNAPQDPALEDQQQVQDQAQGSAEDQGTQNAQPTKNFLGQPSTTTPDTAPIPIDEQILTRKKAILQQMIHNGKIPDMPEVTDAILSGKANVEDVQSKFAEWKKNNPNPQMDQKGNINQPEAQKVQINNDPSFTGRVAQSLAQWADRDMYVASKAIEGFSMGIVGGNRQAPDKTTAIAGTFSMLAGGIASGVLLSVAMPSVPFLGPLIKGMEASAEASTGFLKAAKTVGAIAAEAAPLGFAVGTTGSLVRGNSITDALKDGAVEAAMYAGTGAALYPVIEGAGALFSRAKSARAKTLAGIASKTGEDISANLSQTEGTTATKGFLSGAQETGASEAGEAVTQDQPQVTKSEKIYRDLVNIPEDDRTPQQKQLINQITKINATQPFSGPGITGDISKLPEMQRYKLNQDAAAMSHGLFTAQDAPLGALYQSDPTIKSMVDSGNHIDALNAVQGSLRNEVKNIATMGELVNAPFVNDGESIYNLIADKYAGRIDPEKYPDISRTLIIDHTKNATPETRQALIQAVGGESKAKGLFGDQFLNNPSDMRLDARTQDKVVGDLLKANMETIANGGTVSFENLGKIKDTDAIINAAITANKDIQSTTISAIKDGFGRYSDNFLMVPKEFQDFVGDEFRSRSRMGDMNDMLARKNQLISHTEDLSKQLKLAASDEEKGKLSAALGLARDDLKSVTSEIGLATKEMNESNARLATLPKEQQDQIRGIVDQVYLPSKTQMGIQRTQDFYKRLNFKDDPYLVKKTSQLADYMNMLRVGGAEHDIPQTKGFFGGPLAANFESLPRQINKYLGPGNPISDGLIPTIKERGAMASASYEDYMDRLSHFGVKPGSKLSALVQDFGEGKLKITDPEFQVLSPKDQKTIAGYTDAEGKHVNGIVDEIRPIVKEFFEAANEVRRQNNFPEINYRPDYFVAHLTDDVESFPSIINGFMNGQKEIPLPFEGTRSVSLEQLTRKGDPGKTYFAYDRPRTGKEHVPDAMGALQKYLGSGLKQVHMMDLIREIDAARNFSPEGLGNLLQRIKEEHILGQPHQLDRELNAAPIVKKLIQVGQKGLVQGELIFKVQTAMNQLTATAMNVAAGGREALSSIATMFTKEADRRWGMSINKSFRDTTEGIDINAKLFPNQLKELNKLPYAEQIKAGFDYYKKVGSWGIDFFDMISTKHAYLTGFQKGLNNGMDYNQAQILGDIWADRLQVSMAAIDKPGYARTTLGRALFQFQTYTSCLASTLMNDIPNMAFHEGGKNAVTALMRTAAACSIYNEAMREVGLPAPFSLSTFVPFFSTYRFGVSGLGTAMTSFFNAANKGSFAGAAGNRLKRLGLDIALPGAGQLLNIKEGLEAYQQGKVDKEHLGRSLIFGPNLEKKTKAALAEETTATKIRKKLFS